MDNTTYEFFIRRCWNCERLKHGADTAIWDDLLVKQYHFKRATVGNFVSTQREFKNKLQQVKTYLDKAYGKLIATADTKEIHPETIALLLESRALAAKSSEPTALSDILKDAFVVMNANNL